MAKLEKSVQAVTRRRLMQGAAATGVAAAMMPWSARTASAQGKTLRAGITGYHVINTLDPGKANLIPEAYVVWGTHNALVKFNAKMEIVPDLAESFRYADPTTLEVKLRSGVKFHDGSTMTAEDVKFSFERLQDEKYGSAHKSKFASVTAVETPDATTVRFKTKDPYAPLLAFLTNTRTGAQIVPKKAFTEMGPDQFGKTPIGTGAFKIKEWKSGEKVSLVAHADYFGGAPAMAAVEIPLIQEEKSGVTAILGKQIDLTSTAPFDDIPDLEKKGEVQVMKQAGLNCRFVHMNLRKPPFDDVHFRRAVSMAFDRNALVAAVLFGEGVATPGLIPPSLTLAYGGKAQELASFNPSKAKAELAKSKYKAGTEGKVLTWGAGWWKRFAEVVVAQVNQTLGTKLTVEVSDANAVFQRLKAGDYQASIWGWLGLIDPHEYIGENLHTKGWRNFGGYSNPKLDALIDAALQELDPRKRGEMYKQADAMWLEDMPFLPCFCSNVHNLAVKGLTGFTQLPYSSFGDQFATVKLA